MTTKDCLEMILEPMAESFSVEFARSLAELRASPELQQRMDELAEKANEGKLSEAEEADYKSFIDTSTILAIMQAKARRFIAQRSA